MEKFQLFCVKHKNLATVIAIFAYIIPLSVIFGVIGVSMAVYWVTYIFIALMSILMVSSAPTALVMPAIKKLNDECDPFPLLRVCDEILARTKTVPDMINTKLNRCCALSNMGEKEKNLSELKEIAIESHIGLLPQTKFCYYNNLASAYLSLGDTESARIWFEKSIELLPAIKNKKIHASLEDVCRHSKAELLIAEGSAIEGLALLNTVENNCRARSVGLALARARANIRLGNIDKAKNDLQYVIATGNRLCAVTEAKELLAGLD